jgi:hypothetical protein
MSTGQLGFARSAIGLGGPAGMGRQDAIGGRRLATIVATAADTGDAGSGRSMRYLEALSRFTIPGDPPH